MINLTRKCSLILRMIQGKCYNETMNSSRYRLIFICGLYVILTLSYSCHTPIFEGADELAHFIYVHNLVEDRRLPVIPDYDTAFRTHNEEVHQLPLYYLLAAPWITWTSRHDIADYLRENEQVTPSYITYNNGNVILHPLMPSGDTHLAGAAVRVWSMILGLVTLLCVYHTGRMLWDEQMGLAAMVVLLSIPTFVSLSGLINNDNLSIALASGVLTLTMRTWTRRVITGWDIVGIALLSAAIFLTKLVALTAIVIWIGVHIIGAMIGRYTWRRVLLLMITSMVAVLVLSGWWYVRNYQLYDGDWLAFKPTMRLWSRGTPRLVTIDDMRFIWWTFWMGLAHNNIAIPTWLVPYVSGITILSLIGVVIRSMRVPSDHWTILYLFTTCLVALGMMICINRRIDVAQGRLLYAALLAFAILLVTGWRTLLGRRLFLIPILPVTVVMLSTPLTRLDQTFAPLAQVSVDDPHVAELQRIDARAESLLVHGYRLYNDEVTVGDVVAMDIYFEGKHEENPMLFVTAQHPISRERLGDIDTYPGMAATDSLDADQLYRARLRFQILTPPSDSSPFQIQMALGWRVLDPNDRFSGRFVDWFDAQDRPIGAVFFDGPVYYDPSYTPPSMAVMHEVLFGDQIALRGYTLDITDTEVHVQTLWAAVKPIHEDWILTVGLTDEDDQLLVQHDSPPPGYPTRVWLEEVPIVLSHRLAYDATSTNLRLGWYLPIGTRLAPVDDANEIRDNLLYIPIVTDQDRD